MYTSGDACCGWCRARRHPPTRGTSTSTKPAARSSMTSHYHPFALPSAEEPATEPATVSAQACLHLLSRAKRPPPPCPRPEPSPTTLRDCSGAQQTTARPPQLPIVNPVYYTRPAPITHETPSRGTQQAPTSAPHDAPRRFCRAAAQA